MSGADLYPFSRNELREDIRNSKKYAEYYRLVSQLEQTKLRLRYAPQDNMHRERELMAIMTLADLTDAERTAYKIELNTLQKNRADLIKDLKESVDEQVDEIMKTDYMKRWYTNEDNTIDYDKKIKIGLSF